MARLQVRYLALVAVAITALLAIGCSKRTTAPPSDPPVAPRVQALEAEVEVLQKRLLEVEVLQQRLREMESAQEWRLREERAKLSMPMLNQKGQLITLYLWDVIDNVEVLQPVEVLVPAANVDLRTVAEAWAQGAAEVRLTNGLGAHPKLLSASVRDGVAYLDFDRSFYDFGGSSAWSIAVRISLTYSVTTLEGVEAVRAYVEGEPAHLHGWLWDQPLSRKTLGEIRVAEPIQYRGPKP